MIMEMCQSKKFDNAVSYVLMREGGLVENPNDPGGITNHGISLRFLRSIPVDTLKQYGVYVGTIAESDDILQLTEDQAKEIYRGEFWNKASFLSLNRQEVINYIFIMAVTMGISPAVKCAQRAVWAVLKNKKCLSEDGVLNELTIDLINHCEYFMLPAMRSERASTYKIIVERNPKEKDFLDGWLSRAYDG